MRKRLKDLLPYILILGLAAYGGYAQTSLSHEADLKLCRELNKNRIAILTLINQQSSTIQAPEGSPPFVQQILDVSAERGKAFRERAARELAPQDCDKI